MSFVKIGDAEKITSFLDDDKVIVCDKCGKNINTVKIADEGNEVVCDCAVEENGD